MLLKALRLKDMNMVRAFLPIRRPSFDEEHMSIVRIFFPEHVIQQPQRLNRYISICNPRHLDGYVYYGFRFTSIDGGTSDVFDLFHYGMRQNLFYVFNFKKSHF